jgi:dTDP-4-amino-4,6-dideoxygalactose transaminase
VLRGAVPVFIDIRADTLNLDETLIEAAITPRTRAICVVHYAGVGAEMDTIMAVAARHGLAVIEDAAQGLHATYRGRPLGSFGAFSAFSFHETKNVIAGEAGALVVNDPAAMERAEIIWEKGTNRAQFQRGEVAKYNWVDLGSSFLPSEVTAAFLFAQLEEGRAITDRRLAAWHRYHAAFRGLEEAGRVRRPTVPQECGHNGHIYFLLAPDAAQRDAALAALRAQDIQAVMHYVPLHSAPAGLRFGRVGSDMARTDDLSARLLRLPMHPRFEPALQDRAIDAIRAVFGA